MEVLLVDALAFLALKVFKTIDAQNLMVGKKVVTLQIEKVLSSNC
jgi:hypothetical protein